VFEKIMKIKQLNALSHRTPIYRDAATAFNAKNPSESDRPPFSGGMIRFSVGCEQYEDLEKSVAKALEVVRLD
jgi:cystathionine beta-lyase/cystathionine gamma-synthase